MSLKKQERSGTGTRYETSEQSAELQVQRGFRAWFAMARSAILRSCGTGGSATRYYLWWLEWVVCWEVNIQEEDTTSEGTVRLHHGLSGGYVDVEAGGGTGPMIVACQWKRSSPTGPALQFAGGSLPRSRSSLLIRLSALQ